MHTIEVFGCDERDPKAGRSYTFPGAWGECTLAQLGTTAALASVPVDDEDPLRRDVMDAHRRLRLLHELTGMADAVFTRIDTADLLALRVDEAGAERVAFLPSLDWCFETPVLEKSLVPTLTVNGRMWTGPTDRLGRMTLLQWGFCDLLLGRMAQAPSAEALNHVLGALYHEAATPWTHEHIEARGEQLAGLDDRTKLAALVNYRGLRGWLQKKYRRCFRAGKADPHGLNGMVVRLAGPKFGRVDEVRAANLHDVFIHVEQSLQDKEEMENRQKRP